MNNYRLRPSYHKLQQGDKLKKLGELKVTLRFKGVRVMIIKGGNFLLKVIIKCFFTLSFFNET